MSWTIEIVVLPSPVPGRRLMSAVVSRATAMLAATAIAALAIFHAYLFGASIVDGGISDPAVALRWGTAFLIVAALAALRRRRVSLVGRRAVAIWVLTALLHGPALAAPSSGLTSALPDAVAVLLESTIVGAGVLGLLLAVSRAPRSRRSPVALALRRPAVDAILPRPDLTPRCPRPPPIACLAFRS